VNFLCQCFQKLEHYRGTDRQTHATERNTTLHSLMVIKFAIRLSISSEFPQCIFAILNFVKLKFQLACCWLDAFVCRGVCPFVCLFPRCRSQFNSNLHTKLYKQVNTYQWKVLRFQGQRSRPNSDDHGNTVNSIARKPKLTVHEYLLE